MDGRSAFGLVVIVEFHDGIRELLVVILRHAGFATHVASEFRAAARIARTRRVAAILCDMLPADAARIDGTSSLMRAALRRTIVTTTARESDLRTAVGREVFAVLRKPFDSARIVELVRACEQQNDEEPPAGGPGVRRKVVAALRKFTREVPHLRSLLTAPVTGDRDLFLRMEMRTVISALSGVFADAARQEPCPDRATAFRAASSLAADLATDASFLCAGGVGH